MQRQQRKRQTLGKPFAHECLKAHSMHSCTQSMNDVEMEGGEAALTHVQTPQAAEDIEMHSGDIATMHPQTGDRAPDSV